VAGSCFFFSPSVVAPLLLRAHDSMVGQCSPLLTVFASLPIWTVLGLCFTVVLFLPSLPALPLLEFPPLFFCRDTPGWSPRFFPSAVPALRNRQGSGRIPPTAVLVPTFVFCVSPFSTISDSYRCLLCVPWSRSPADPLCLYSSYFRFFPFFSNLRPLILPPS